MPPPRTLAHKVSRLRLAATAALLGVVASSAPAGSAASAKSAPADVCYLPDLTYRTVGDQKLMLDLAYPQAGKGPYPAVLVIHGTGLLTAGRKGQVPLVLDLARAGYAAAAISYRYSPAEPFPAAVEDLEHAVRWLRGNAGRYRINPERFATVGFSGGGCLACLLGLAPPDKGDPASAAARVQAVVSYFGPTDLVRLHTTALMALKSPSFSDRLHGLYIRSMLEKWLGGPPARVPARYAAASPITHARKGAAPVLLIHGTADAVVPPEQSELLARKLQAVGGRARLLLLEHAPHDFEELDDANARQAAAAVRAFLAEHLKGRLKQK